MAKQRKKTNGSRAGILIRVPKALYEAIKDVAIVERRAKFAQTCNPVQTCVRQSRIGGVQMCEM